MKNLAFAMALASLVGCAPDDDDDSGGSTSSVADRSCRLPDVYIVRYTEIDGNCGPRSPAVVRAASDGVDDTACSRVVDVLTCFISGEETCVYPDVVTRRNWFVDGTVNVWSGEETVQISTVDGGRCSGVYAITVSPG